MTIGIVCVMHKCNKCSRNSFDIINGFISSLFKYLKDKFKLYLFDNESDEKYHVPKHSNIEYKYIRNQSLRGLYVINDGIAKAISDGCDIILIVGDDIIFNESINKFIYIIRNHIYNKVGLYGPLTNGVLNNTLQKARKAGKGIVEITNQQKSYGILSGFCLGFTKDFYYRYRSPQGNICEASNKWGGGERNLINRMKRDGGRVFIIKDCWIFHYKFREWKLRVKRKKKNEGNKKTKNNTRKQRVARR